MAYTKTLMLISWCLFRLFTSLFFSFLHTWNSNWHEGGKNVLILISNEHFQKIFCSNLSRCKICLNYGYRSLHMLSSIMIDINNKTPRCAFNWASSKYLRSKKRLSRVHCSDDIEIACNQVPLDLRDVPTRQSAYAHVIHNFFYFSLKRRSLCSAWCGSEEST